jgi:hypothetical protein
MSLKEYIEEHAAENESLNVETFIRKFLDKKQRARIAELSAEWNEAVENDDDVAESDARSQMERLLDNPTTAFAKSFFADGEPTEDAGFVEERKGDLIEIILRKWDEGWVASVRTNYWDAPASTIDPSLAKATPAEAFAWGFFDAMTYHLLNEGA